MVVSEIPQNTPTLSTCIATPHAFPYPTCSVDYNSSRLSSALTHMYVLTKGKKNTHQL